MTGIPPVNVLGSKNARRTGRMMNLIMKAAATPTPEHHHIATPHRNGNKRFCSVSRVRSFRFENSFYVGRHV